MIRHRTRRRKLASGWPRHGARPFERARLCLESLEDRTLLNGHTLAAATPLSFDTRGIAESVGVLPSTDFFAVTLPEPGRLVARVHAQGESTRLSLLGTDGGLLIQSDGQSAANPDDLIDQHLDGGSTYYLKLEGLDNPPGSYQLEADFAAAAPPFAPISVGKAPIAMVTGDFLGDGRTDLAVADEGAINNSPVVGSDVRVLLSLGDGAFRTKIIPVGQAPRALVAADFTGDGRTDLAVADLGSFIRLPDGNYGDVGSDVRVLLPQGDGTFRTETYQVGMAPLALATGDFTGDGRTDIAVASAGEFSFDPPTNTYTYFDSSVTVLLNNGDSTFRTETYSVGPDPWAIIAGHFTDSGHTDLAVTDTGGFGSNSGSSVTMLLGNGDGTFRTETLPVGSTPIALTAGDFTGNGRTDLAVANQGTRTFDSSNDTWSYLGSSVSVLLSNGDGTFQTENNPVGQAPRVLVAGDFTGNGHVDLATLDNGANGFGGITVLFGQGDGTFHTQAIPAGPGDGPAALMAADLTGNGRTDLVVADGRANDVKILMSQSDGTFESQSVWVGNNPGALAAGDLSGNGRKDLAVAQGAGSVALILGEPDGMFRAAASSQAGIVPVGSGPVSTVAADFTGNGHSDLAVANWISNDVTVMLGQGDGTFRTETIPAGPGPYDIVTGDFNGDGRPDLAIADNNANEVTVLLGQGDGTFRSETIPVGVGPFSGPFALVTGDFLGNGRTDLAVACREYYFDPVLGDAFLGSLSVLLNNGDGTFQTETIPLGTFLTGLAAGDFFGDGHTDLAVADAGALWGSSDAVTVVRVQPDGTLRTQTIPVGPSPEGILAGDFTGDGRADLASINQGNYGLQPDGSYAYVSDVTVLVGEPDGTIHTQTIPAGLNAGQNAQLGVAAVTGDFAGNGRTDLAIVNGASYGPLPSGGYGYSSNAAVTLLLAQENGAFQSRSIPMVQQPGYDPGYNVTAADFTDSGRTELAISGFSSSDITLLLAQNDGSFRTETLSLDQPPGTLLAADLNGDGRTDLAVGTDQSTNVVDILLGRGDGTFVSPDQLNNPMRSSPVVADLNGDRLPDIITLEGSGQILYRAGRSAALGGGFAAPVIVNSAGEPAARDVVLVHTYTGTVLAALDAQDAAVSFYALTNGDGFALIGRLALPGPLPVRLAAADLNGDGVSDLVVADAGAQAVSVFLQSPSPEPGGASALVGPTAGPFFPSTPDYQIPVGVDPTDLALADLSGNGRPDILVTDQFSGDVTVIHNTNAAPFASTSRFRAGTGLFGLDASTSTAAIQSDIRPVGVVPVRFDKKGQADLVVTDQVDDRFSVLHATGTGGYFNPQESSSYTTGGQPSVVVSGAFNGDGIPDLAVLNDATGTISIFLGKPDGSFIPAGTYSAGNQPTGLSVADINHTGHVDLLVGNQYGDLLILLGNGDGTFKPYERAGDHVALAVADLTGNGKDDLILANQSLDQVTVAYGTAQQSFNRSEGLLSPSAVKLADLNGDGIADLIVANGGGNDVLVYPGLGNGQFGPAQRFFTGTDPVSVTVADLTGSGIPDLVVADQGSNDVTILLGQGTGATWTMKLGPRLNSGGIGPVSTVVKDVTGPNGVPDGIPDIVVSNATSSNLAVLPGVGQGFFNDRQPIITPLPGAGALASLAGEGVVVADPQGNLLSIVPDVRQPDFAQISSGGSDPQAVLSGDFLGDGHTDLIVANNGDGLIDFFAGDAQGFRPPEALPLEVLHPTDLAVSNVDDVLYVVGENGQIGRFDLQRLALLGRETVQPTSLAASSAVASPIAVPLPLKDASVTLVATLLTSFPEESMVGVSPAVPAVSPSSSSGGDATESDADGTGLVGENRVDGARGRLNDFLLGIGGSSERRPIGGDGVDTGPSNGDPSLPSGKPKSKETPPPSEHGPAGAEPDAEQAPEVLLPHDLEPSSSKRAMPDVSSRWRTTPWVARPVRPHHQGAPAVGIAEDHSSLSAIMVTAFFASGLSLLARERKFGTVARSAGSSPNGAPPHG
jgi:hypothetical protein